MVKPLVPTITAEDVAKCDAEATARAAETQAQLLREPEPKPKKALKK